MSEYDLVVIGSGPGGYVAAIYAAQLGLKTACVERRKTLGGTCLNIGCIPSKCLLHSSELFWKANTELADHGIELTSPTFNFSKMMQRKTRVVEGFVKGIDLLFHKNKVKRLQGHAKFIDPHTIDVDGKKISAKNFIIATGSEPIEIPFLPFDEKQVVSSTGALDFSTIPKKLLVVGAGVIGVELGSVYARLGSEIIFIELLDHICPGFDLSLSRAALKIFQTQKMQFHLSHKVIGAEIKEKEVILQIAGSDKEFSIQGDKVLVCVGRRPYTKDLGLKEVGIESNQKGFIKVDAYFRTNLSHIFAIGDVIEGPMLAHKASEEGIATASFIAKKTSIVRYAAIPSVAYTFPEIAAVGFTEKALKEKQIPYKGFSFPFKANSRARCTNETEGFVRILIHKQTRHILGVHIISAHASELIAEGVLCLQKKMRIEELAHTSHAHPTLSEAIKEAALGVYDKPIHL